MGGFWLANQIGQSDQRGSYSNDGSRVNGEAMRCSGAGLLAAGLDRRVAAVPVETGG